MHQRKKGSSSRHVQSQPPSSMQQHHETPRLLDEPEVSAEQEELLSSHVLVAPHPAAFWAVLVVPLALWFAATLAGVAHFDGLPVKRSDVDHALLLYDRFVFRKFGALLPAFVLLLRLASVHLLAPLRGSSVKAAAYSGSSRGASGGGSDAATSSDNREATQQQQQQQQHQHVDYPPPQQQMKGKRSRRHPKASLALTGLLVYLVVALLRAALYIGHLAIQERPSVSPLPTSPLSSSVLPTVQPSVQPSVQSAVQNGSALPRLNGISTSNVSVPGIGLDQAADVKYSNGSTQQYNNDTLQYNNGSTQQYKPYTELEAATNYLSDHVLLAASVVACLQAEIAATVSDMYKVEMLSGSFLRLLGLAITLVSAMFLHFATSMDMYFTCRHFHAVQESLVALVMGAVLFQAPVVVWLARAARPAPAGAKTRTC